jgi:hypothetical protein
MSPREGNVFVVRSHGALGRIGEELLRRLRRARRSDARRTQRHDAVSRISRHLVSLRILSPRTRRLWTAFDLLPSSASAPAC